MEDFDFKTKKYLVVEDGYKDGLVHFDSCVPEFFDTLEDAVEYAKDQVNEDGIKSFIFEMRPVKHVVIKPVVKDAGVK